MLTETLRTQKIDNETIGFGITIRGKQCIARRLIKEITRCDKCQIIGRRFAAQCIELGTRQVRNVSTRDSTCLHLTVWHPAGFFPSLGWVGGGGVLLCVRGGRNNEGVQQF